EQHAINFEHARQDVRRKRREFASDFDKWTRGNGKEQQQDGKSSSRDAKIERGGIESDKQRSFKHTERERFIRANKLAADYEREGLEHVFARQIEREQEHERAISRNEGTQRTDEKLYQSSHERGNGERSHDTQSIESDSRKIGQSHEQHAI